MIEVILGIKMMVTRLLNFHESMIPMTMEVLNGGCCKYFQKEPCGVLFCDSTRNSEQGVVKVKLWWRWCISRKKGVTILEARKIKLFRAIVLCRGMTINVVFIIVESVSKPRNPNQSA